MHFKRSVMGAAVGLALSTIAGTASAAGFALTEQGSAGLGMAYAGAAAATWDASTVWWNPAGMSSLPGRQVVASGNIVVLSFGFNDNGSTLPAFQPANAARGDGGDAGGTFFIPSAFLTWQLNPEWWLGVGFNGPFGLTTKWNDEFVGRFQAIESDIKTYNLNPSIAWKPNNWLSLGAGFNIQYLDGTFTQYTNYAGAVAGGIAQQCAALPPLQQAACLGQIPATVNGLNVSGQGAGMTEAKGNSWGWGWNLGVMLSPTPSTKVGITYRSAVTHDVEGDISFSSRPAALATPLQNGPIKAEVKLPSSFSLALSQGIGSNLRLLADYTWTGWDSIQELAFVRQGPGAALPPTHLNFKDAWRIGVGAEYQLNSAWLLRIGTAYDKTPVQDEYRTPRLPDNDRWWLSIGARWTFSPQGAVDFGYSYLIVDDTNTVLPPNGSSEIPAVGQLRGSYSASTSIIGAQLRWNF
jgi:long-chain fatty acid transport protein